MKFAPAAVLFSRRALLASAAALPLGAALARQLRAADPAGIQLGRENTQRWRFGLVVKAPGGLTGGQATMPVPMDWPEQSVKLLSEERSQEIKPPTYRLLEGGVRQMVVSLPRIPRGGEATLTMLFEVTKRDVDPPADTAGLQLPEKTSKETAGYLLPSPYIESTDAKIKSLAKEIAAGQVGWRQPEAIYDWVREHVKYKFAEQIKPAVDALRDGEGDCEELTSLFIALCRAQRIPARAVWVPGHCYPEFYLQDAQGQGHWYPCQAAGSRLFGAMREDRPILQKGDNFRIPEERQPQRYVRHHFKAANAPADPEVKFILERAD